MVTLCTMWQYHRHHVEVEHCRKSASKTLQCQAYCAACIVPDGVGQHLNHERPMRQVAPEHHATIDHRGIVWIPFFPLFPCPQIGARAWLRRIHVATSSPSLAKWHLCAVNGDHGLRSKKEGVDRRPADRCREETHPESCHKSKAHVCPKKSMVSLQQLCDLCYSWNFCEQARQRERAVTFSSLAGHLQKSMVIALRRSMVSQVDVMQCTGSYEKDRSKRPMHYSESLKSRRQRRTT
mmetsp:Transcript_107040/g.194802  ORF Transcript_107040/g.194802 Transcript_107040/m.194802 type:complete len:237 (+) Transcript_107040:2381-3091(+)